MLKKYYNESHKIYLCKKGSVLGEKYEDTYVMFNLHNQVRRSSYFRKSL